MVILKQKNHAAYRYVILDSGIVLDCSNMTNEDYAFYAECKDVYLDRIIEWNTMAMNIGEPAP